MSQFPGLSHSLSRARVLEITEAVPCTDMLSTPQPGPKPDGATGWQGLHNSSRCLEVSCDISLRRCFQVFPVFSTGKLLRRLSVVGDDTRAKTRVQAIRVENREADTGHDYEGGRCGQSGATHVRCFRGSLTCGAGDERGGKVRAERRHTLSISRKTNVIFSENGGLLGDSVGASQHQRLEASGFTL